MEVMVDGWRAGIEDREAAKAIPRDRLPALTNEQKEVARKLGISEEDYARSAAAGEQSRERLLQKTERFARWLEAKVTGIKSTATVDRAVLRTIDHRFEVQVKMNGRPISLRVDEDVVDDFFDSGSDVAGKQLDGVVERALLAASA